jgi:hypothetical protein
MPGGLLFLSYLSWPELPELAKDSAASPAPGQKAVLTGKA